MEQDDYANKHIKVGEPDAGSAASNKLLDEQSAKPSEPPKQDYIHVRARKGQANDSHSLAERVILLHFSSISFACWYNRSFFSNENKYYNFDSHLLFIQEHVAYNT